MTNMTLFLSCLSSLLPMSLFEDQVHRSIVEWLVKAHTALVRACFRCVYSSWTMYAQLLFVSLTDESVWTIWNLPTILYFLACQVMLFCYLPKMSLYQFNRFARWITRAIMLLVYSMPGNVLPKSNYSREDKGLKIVYSQKISNQIRT